MAAVVVSYDTRELTEAAVASVLDSRGVRAEVWVVDNASSDGSAEALRSRFPEARVVGLEENVGFGRANNVAFERVDADYVLLLNSDARLRDPGDLHEMIRSIESHPRVGVVGPRLESPEGRIEYSVRAFPSILAELARGTGLHKLLPSAVRERRLAGELRDPSRRGAADWLTGACLLTRVEVLREVGGFDPEIFLYGEELDWCWRVRQAGWEIVYDPAVTVTHRRGASGGALAHGKLRLAMAGDAYVLRKHRGAAYLLAFAAARVLGLTSEVAVQGALALLGRDGQRRARARYARAALPAWLSALARGGSRRPGGPRIRPSGGGAATA